MHPVFGLNGTKTSFISFKTKRDRGRKRDGEEESDCVRESLTSAFVGNSATDAPIRSKASRTSFFFLLGGGYYMYPASQLGYPAC